MTRNFSMRLGRTNGPVCECASRLILGSHTGIDSLGLSVVFAELASVRVRHSRNSHTEHRAVVCECSPTLYSGELAYCTAAPAGKGKPLMTTKQKITNRNGTRTRQ